MNKAGVLQRTVKIAKENVETVDALLAPWELDPKTWKAPKELVPNGYTGKETDFVPTPPALARLVVETFTDIEGKVLEPCAGYGSFAEALRSKAGVKVLTNELPEVVANTGYKTDYQEDFLAWPEDRAVDWVVTNPPWSLSRKFLQKSMAIAHDVVFLISPNHVTALRGRRRDQVNAGFGLKAILEVDIPKEWPQSGFTLGAVWLQKGYNDLFIIGKEHWENAS